jgi:hypothetical protein
MRAIGFRASPKHVTFAVVEGPPGQGASPYSLVAADVVTVPPALHPPDQLHFIRTVLLDVMEEFNVQRAGLRLAEPIAKASYPFRDNIEGVIQELLASSAVEYHVAGINSRLTAKLGLGDKTLFKSFCDGTASPEFITKWSEIKPEYREPVLAAVAALRGKAGMVSSAVDSSHGPGLSAGATA